MRSWTFLLDSMKAALKEHIKVSPLDTSKDLLVWSDAAPSEGMCYVIAQWRDPEDHKKGVNIVSCDSTTFNGGKRSLNPFEAELAGVHWALTKEHYFTCGAPRITVFCNCEGLGRFLADDMEKIKNARARAMVEEIQIYPIEVVHVPGAKMELLDHGSRNPISYGHHK